MYFKFIYMKFIFPALSGMYNVCKSFSGHITGGVTKHIKAYNDFCEQSLKEKEMQVWISAARKVRKEDPTKVYKRSRKWLKDHGLTPDYSKLYLRGHDLQQIYRDNPTYLGRFFR